VTGWDALHPGCVRKPQRAGVGYQYVKLSAGGTVTSQYVHVMVLTAFTGPCPPGMECLHDDDDKTNNRLPNLSWGTHATNQRESALRNRTAMGERNGQAKLTDEQVSEIRAAWTAGVQGIALADFFEVSRAQVSRIVNQHNRVKATVRADSSC